MEELQEIPDLSLPSYLPMTRDTIGKYGTLISSKDDSIIKIDKSLSQIKTHVDDFLEFIIQESLYTDIQPIQDIMKSNMKSIVSLLRSKFAVERWKEVIKQVKQEINQYNSSDVDLTLSTLQQFRESTNLPIASLIQKENEKILQAATEAELKAYINGNSLYQFVRNISLLIEDPEQPLPDDVDDNEIEVSGGKVSLKDPMSYKIFSNPVKSKKCGHVYERNIIEDYLENSSTCPISGCENRINKMHLITDELMLLRVKVFKSKQTVTDEQHDIERL